MPDSLSLEFSRQEYWSELPFPSPGDLPNPGLELVSLTSSARAGGFFAISATWEAQSKLKKSQILLFFQRFIQSHHFMGNRWGNNGNSGRLYLAAAAAKLLQSCPTLCDPRDSSPQGSPIPGILQARTLEWVAISFSNA